MTVEKFIHKTDINRHDFRTMAEILATKGIFLSKINSILKVIVIILGTLVAAKGSLNAIFKAAFDLPFFTVAGLLVAIITSLEATFKFERRSIELYDLSNKCNSLDKEFSIMRDEIVDIKEPEEFQVKARTSLRRMHADLEKIYSKSSNLGFNLNLAVNRVNKKLAEKMNKMPSKPASDIQ